MLAMGIPVYMMAALTVLFASINGQVGFALGCFYGVRMILLVLGSFIVVLPTTSTALTDALRSFVSPLRALHVPADDIAMVFSMAIRFIPLMAQELCAIHDAQFSRGASFRRGGLWQRVSAWPPVFIRCLWACFEEPISCRLPWTPAAMAFGVAGEPRCANTV